MNDASQPTRAVDTPCPAPTKLPAWQNEDWLAVYAGSFLILAVLAALASGSLSPTAPRFKWQHAGDFAASAADPAVGLLGHANLLAVATVATPVFVLAMVAVGLMGGKVGRFALGFPVVYGLALLALLAAGNAQVNALGLEYVIFALISGLVISNTVGTPQWLREAARTELYIKTGLVVLGTGVLFGEIIQAGSLGVLQVLAVVTAVWFFCFWLAKKLRVDDEFAAILASAVSICGVSAAIAACGAIQGDRKKLSYVTSLVLIVALPMMVAMPWLVKAGGIPDVVGGAWLGGTLDTSGSVVAAGELVSKAAVKVGVIVKLSQNVLMGAAAFFLSLWWTMRQTGPATERPTLAVIWERFPKFVLGFAGASLLFSVALATDTTSISQSLLGSFGLAPETFKAAKPLLDAFRTVLFALAFASIGLETRFSELVRMEGGRPAMAFIGAQAFNVLWTLLIAWLLFGGILLAAPVFD